jgi:hypothetical protein
MPDIDMKRDHPCSSQKWSENLPLSRKLGMISYCNRTHSRNMYFLSVPFSKTSTTCATDGILFPKDLRGMKKQMISKEDAIGVKQGLYR